MENPLFSSQQSLDGYQDVAGADGYADVPGIDDYAEEADLNDPSYADAMNKGEVSYGSPAEFSRPQDDNNRHLAAEEGFYMDLDKLNPGGDNDSVDLDAEEARNNPDGYMTIHPTAE